MYIEHPLNNLLFSLYELLIRLWSAFFIVCFSAFTILFSIRTFVQYNVYCCVNFLTFQVLYTLRSPSATNWISAACVVRPARRQGDKFHFKYSQFFNFVCYNLCDHFYFPSVLIKISWFRWGCNNIIDNFVWVAILWVKSFLRLNQHST